MFNPKELLNKTEVATILAKVTADKLKDAGLDDLDVPDVLGMAVTSILGVLLHDHDDHDNFITALQGALLQFRATVALKDDPELRTDPMSALARVVSEQLPRDKNDRMRRKVRSFLQDMRSRLDLQGNGDVSSGLLEKIKEAAGHKNCAGCRDSNCKDPRTPEWFMSRVGREPTKDEMRIVNCGCAGEPRHATCGVCKTCDMPFMLCTCV